jgi:hypothetical protein
LASPSVFNDIYVTLLPFPVSYIVEGVENRKKGLRTEQRHTKNSYLNDDLAAIALPVGKHKSKVFSPVCSELRKFRDFEDTVRDISIRAYQKPRSLKRWSKFLTWACITIPDLCRNHYRLQFRHHYSEFVEAYTPRGWQGYLLFHKAIANGVRKMEVR